MVGEDEAETGLLRDMLNEAKIFVQSFSWCDAVTNSYFAGGVGRVFAVFLFKISTRNPAVDPWEWIFVGDMPSAYLPVEDAGSKLEAFDTYVEGMKRWVEFARRREEPGRDDRVPPVNVPATPEWAEVLDRRLVSLIELIRPLFE